MTNKQLIVKQAKELYTLRNENKRLADDIGVRQRWLRKAKKDAGFNDSVSFDKVWEATLKAYVLHLDGKKPNKS